MMGVPNASERGTKSKVARKWDNRLCHTWSTNLAQPFTTGDKITSGGEDGTFATSPLRHERSATVQSWRQNQTRPGSRHINYVTNPLWGVRNDLEWGTQVRAADHWAYWLHHPCRVGAPQDFGVGKKIRSGREVGRLATGCPPYGGSPKLHNGRKIGCGQEKGRLAMLPLPHGPSPMLESGGQNRNWPTSGHLGYIRRTVKGAQRFKVEDKIRGGPQVDKLAMSTLPYGAVNKMRSGRQVGRLPTSPLPHAWSPTVES